MRSRQKFLIFVIILFLILPGQAFAVPVHAEEAPEETINLVDVFYVLTTQRDHSMTVPFDRSWFRGDARVYDHDLAKLSLGLATSAFRPNKQLAVDTRPQDYNLRSFLYQAGFEDLRSDDYDKNPSMYTVSTVMGHQKIGEGEQFPVPLHRRRPALYRCMHTRQYRERLYTSPH